MAQPVLILSSPSSTDITIKINSTDGTAIGSYNLFCVYHYVHNTGNVDYIPGPYNVTFPAGETRIYLNISLSDNDTRTYAEFLLVIVYSNEAVIGDNGQTIVAIITRTGIYIIMVL